MLKRLVIAAASLLMALGTLAPVRASHSWEDNHWARATNPFSVTLVDSLDAAWDAFLPPVSSDWSQSNVLDTAITSGASDVVTRLVCLPSSSKVVICNANYGPNLWLGQATVWLNGDHITQGTVQLNDFYFSLAQYNNAAERRHVLCQEVGHTFGLDHQSESGESLNTCMDYYDNTSNSDTKSTTPNQHDYEQLSLIYQHLDAIGRNGDRGGGCHGWNCKGSAYRSSDKIVMHVGDTTIIRFIYWI